MILLGNLQACASPARERKPLEGTEAIRVEPARLAFLARLGDGQCRLPGFEGLVGRPQLGRQSGKLGDAATDTAPKVTSATFLTRSAGTAKAVAALVSSAMWRPTESSYTASSSPTSVSTGALPPPSGAAEPLSAGPGEPADPPVPG